MATIPPHTPRRLLQGRGPPVVLGKATAPLPTPARSQGLRLAQDSASRLSLDRGEGEGLGLWSPECKGREKG